MNTLIDPAGLPERLRRELQKWDSCQPIAADGSDRRFYRLTRPGETCICLYHPQPPGEPVTENDSYDYIGRHLRRQGLPVPEIFVYCREEGWFLLEDLGDRSLQEQYLLLADAQARLALYRQALELLVDLQIFGSRGFSATWCFDTPVYDAALVRERECAYFLRAFVQGYLGLEIAAAALAADFEWLLARALEPAQGLLLHRDFQSRNLMVRQGKLWLLDFQGARSGPGQYDLAALLLDPYVNLPRATQEDLMSAYLERLQHYVPIEPAAWRRQYQYVALCRNLQILGAYGFLSQQKGKTFFRQFIPAACRSLEQRWEALPAGELPALKRLAGRIGARCKG